ncbi:MAG TPA: branched-chain amino acid ABC transporter substrate-binding protein [Solirubrobacteraceae bacterium]|nr:branched-chain amino acid ABC transporter substrate-binding protein [Solirubrobacteraceae bacterium]
MRLATASTGPMKWARRAFATLATLAILSGCGAKDAQPTRIRGNTLTVYVSVPLLGASRVSGEAVVDGAELALSEARNRIGRYHILLRPLNDATAQRQGWDPGQTTVDARVAVLDPTTIGYVGDLNSGASAVSIPPLNRAGIPQISPTSSAVGLTSSVLGANPGEPQKYYPTDIRTFARVAPNDSVQAIAQVRVQQGMGCTKVYVLNDGEVDGADAAASYEVAARAAGLRVVGIQEFPRDATSYRGLATGVAHTRPDCVLIAADTESGAVPLTTALAAAMPDVKIFGTAGLAESTYFDPAAGGIPLSVDSHVVLTAPTLPIADYPASARAFATAYERRYGPLEPVSILGYEAMSLMLNAITRATHNGTAPAVRSKVRDAIFATRGRRSVLGTYSIDPDGDTTLRRYGVYTIADGQLSLWEAVTA